MINPRSFERGFVVLLMLVTEKIVDRFDGVKGAERNLDKDRRPIAHSTIP